LLDSDVQDVLIFLLSLLSTTHDFSFLILVSKSEVWKGRHFHGRPRAVLSLATPLAAQAIPTTRHSKANIAMQNNELQ